MAASAVELPDECQDGPRFSVFIPVWNDARWLAGAIESVLAQSYPAWELIVGDNASTDDTEAVAKRYADARIRYHRWVQHTDMWAGNFNRTMSLCRFEWVQPLSADDRLAPQCLENMARFLHGAAGSPRKVVAVVGACRRVDEQGRPADRAFYGHQRVLKIPSGIYDGEAWLRVNGVPGQQPWNIGAAAIARDVVTEVGGFRPEIGLAADLELFLRLAAYGDVAFLNEPLLDFTVRCGSVSGGSARENLVSGERLAPVGTVWLSALNAHAWRRRVSSGERARIHAAVARAQLQRALQQRIASGGRGRSGALLDVLQALRYSPLEILAPHRLSLAVATVFAPRQALLQVVAMLTSFRRDRTASHAEASPGGS